MFYALIRFNILNKTVINYEETKILLFEKEKKQCWLNGIGHELKKAKILMLEYGSFDSPEEAHQAGVSLMQTLKKYCVSRHIPIKISGEAGIIDDKSVHVTQSAIASEARSKYGISDRVINDFIGLKIVEVENEIGELSLFTSYLSAISAINKFELNLDTRIYDEKAQTALSMLNSSNVLLVTDMRAAFVLIITAVEALVGDSKKRDGEFVAEINRLMKMTNSQPHKNELGRLKNKTIGEKCREIVGKYAAKMDFDALELWNKSYGLRSQFVHTGNLQLDEFRDSIFPLYQLALQVVDGYISDIPSN